ncbi:hypothetical protein [Hyphomicrobium sp.]|uniref:hypothetical protein n=1 Tax=Hyphomicrobium sp. TaxID=82 RepID=UPI0025BB2902|nr:hypothetical protein [Hyphomicrobium sp.]MCC7250400.1 hypothetical protein [Hyphomicrobium sp.]
MSMFGLGELLGLDDSMARVRAKKADVLDEQLVSSYVERLNASKTDRAAFDDVFVALKADKQLKAADVIAIAQRYSKAGTKPSSKAMAFAAISKRFVEIVRFHAKNKIAEKVRPW